MIKPPVYFTEDHAVGMTLRDWFAGKALRHWLINTQTQC